MKHEEVKEKDGSGDDWLETGRVVEGVKIRSELEGRIINEKRWTERERERETGEKGRMGGDE